MIFHKHSFILVGSFTKYNHTTEKRNWKQYGKDICPYPGCTRKIKKYLCQKCGEEKEIKIDL